MSRPRVRWVGIYMTAGLLCVLCALVVNSAPPAYADKTNLLILRDEQGKETPITTPEQWAKRRAHILANMQLVMGPLPDDSRKVPLDVKITDTVETKHYVRKKLTYAAEKGDRVPAYLLIPVGMKGTMPAGLCLHQP